MPPDTFPKLDARRAQFLKLPECYRMRAGVHGRKMDFAPTGAPDMAVPGHIRADCNPRFELIHLRSFKRPGFANGRKSGAPAERLLN